MQTTRPRYDFPFFSLNARNLLAHGACATLAGIGLVGLGLGNTLGQDLSILVGLVLDLLGLAALESGTVTLVLETLGGDESLDARSLGVRGLALTLRLDLSSDNVLADL
jgi:hypothetical protein